MELDVNDGDNTLVKRSDQLLYTLSNLIGSLPHSYTSGSVETTIKLINEFELNPSLLDPKLPEYIAVLSNLYLEQFENVGEATELSNASGLIVYNLSKVRGFKTITGFFSSDVYLVTRLIEIIRVKNLGENEVFLNLTWLSNSVMVPFPFNDEMINLFFDIGLQNLHQYFNGSKNQVCALLLLSRFLSRPELILLGYLDKYFKDLFNNWATIEESVKLGHFMVINKLLKTCPKTSKSLYLDSIYKCIIQVELLHLATIPLNGLNLSYVIKILSKLGQQYIEVEQFKSVEDILNNLVNDIFKLFGESFETSLRYCMAKALSNMSKQLQVVVNYHEQFIAYVIQKLELRLKLDEFALVEINFDNISIPKYHTILLYLGYCLLNKSLPVTLYPVVLSVVHRTLFANQHRYNLNIGNQLKDSSCFIIWSMLRALNKDSYKELDTNNQGMFNQIFVDILEVAICDKDLTIRRCGVAVIQEFIGRFGQFLLQLGDEHFIGKQSINLIELFTPGSVSTILNSLDILDKLLDLGFDKSLALDILSRNISRSDNDFSYQKQISKKLNDVLKSDSTNSLDLGVYCPPITFDSLVKAYESLTHKIYFKSELWLNFESTPKHIYDITLKEFNNELVEDFLKFLQYCVNVKYLGNQEDLFRKIIHKKKDISLTLIELFELMTKRQLTISQNVFISFLQHFTVPLAKSIFYLHNLDKIQLAGLIEIIHSTHIDYEIRAELIKGIHTNCKHLCLDEELLKDMLCLLNDYTTTEQGDVGSQIRSAMLEFISSYPQRFKEMGSPVLMESLVRISGESMAKLRNQAFSLLLQITDGIEVDTDIFTESQYYERLFKIYDCKIHDSKCRSEFWKGIVFSMGGLTGDSTNIKQSFRNFVQYLETCPYEKRKEIIKELFSVITKKKVELQRNLKEYLQGLNVIIKMFESNVKIPPEYLSPLYAKCYNLQINTNNFGRIKLTMKVMQCLILQNQLQPNVSKNCLERILSILKTHKSYTIRQYALELLYELLVDVQDEKYKELEAIDLNDTSKVNEMSEYLLKKL